jgi:hypothetical protein
MSFDVKQLAAIAALNKMFQDGSINICAVDTVAKMLGLTPAAEPYAVLRALHCVSFNQMPAELRDQLPRLVKECLNVEPTFQFKQPITLSEFVERVPEPQRPAITRLLGFGGKK